MTCLFSRAFRFFGANGFRPYQLISTRLVRRDERFVAILNAIGEGQEDARSEGQLAVGLRYWIIQGLSTRKGGGAAELFRVSRVRCALGKGLIRMRAITRVVID